MHLKVFVKLKKTLKTLSSGQKNPKKPKKNPKNPKKPKKTQKNPLGWVFLKKTGFFPTLVSWVTTTSPEGHLDLDEGLVAVGQQVLGLARVDTHHAQQQVTARTQRHLHLEKFIN